MRRKRLLDDFTKEEYFSLRTELGKDELIAEKIGVCLQTLKTWRKENGIILGKANRKPEIPTDERVKIIRDMLSKGYSREVIAQRVKFKNKGCLSTWISRVKKSGIAI